jgi:hypothetical protein
MGIDDKGKEERSSFLKKRSKRLLIVCARLAGSARKGTLPSHARYWVQGA